MESSEIGPHLRNIKSERIHCRLPEEIIQEIISRLPVKSLLKFRCVSKSWLSLIDSKRFIRTHLEISKRSSNLTHHRIINWKPSNRSLIHLSLYSLMDEPVTDSLKLDVPICYSHSIRFVGCCDGLICFIMDKKHFLLCNPSTRTTNQLPALGNKSERFRVWKYGFGFDEATGDYKVLAILTVYGRNGTGYERIGKLYSLKTDSWKISQGLGGDAHTNAGKLVNGRLHWMIDFNIQTFDLGSEVCGVVEQPFYTGEAHLTSLDVLDGCLCVIYYYRQTKFDFWILKQYGVTESWNKLVTIPYLDHPLWKERCFLPPLIAPLYIGPNKEIVFTCGGTYVIYYPEDNRCFYPQINSLDAFDAANIYIESLVSLRPDGEGE